MPMQAWSPVIGPIILPDSIAQAIAGPQPFLDGLSPQSQYDASILKHLNQMPWDHEFHIAAPSTLIASASQQRIIDFTPSAHRLGIVRGVAMGVANLADFDNIRWAIKVDGMAWPGFDNIIGPFGVFVYPKPILIPLYPDQTVEIVASNLTALPIPLVTGYLMGTHFPADTFRNGGGA